MDRFLEPTYLESDFETSKQRLQELMEKSETFRDYNYEGANITMLLELIAFLNDNSTYFMNKLVKNIYPESAEVYETMHSVAGIRGYKPKGWVAPNLNLKVNVLVNEDDERLPSPGEQLMIPAWYRIFTEVETEEGGNISYMTTTNWIITIPEDADEEYTFYVILKEGDYHTMEYTGEDIVDNKIILPFSKFDFDTRPYDINSSIILYVDEEPWTRVEEFRHTVLEDDNEIYMLEYDKYQRYNIVFSPTHKIPHENSRIHIVANVTSGPEGDIYSNYITDFNEEDDIPRLTEDGIVIETQRFLQNITRDMVINKDFIEVWNPDTSYNSNTPETVQEIRRNSRGNIYSQYRNVNSRDYKIHLAEHPDIAIGNAWGEKEVNPRKITEYNKAYISVIPKIFGTDTIDYVMVNWDREQLQQNQDVVVPMSYNSSFTQSIFEHTSSRKMLGIYEILVVPWLVHFAFDIGLTVKRSYNFVNVREEVKRKLDYYFKTMNREFNEIIDFKKLQYFILDESVRDDNNDRFQLTKGIESVVFRDISTFTPQLSGDTYTDPVSADTYTPSITGDYDPKVIFEPNDDHKYPQYTEEDFELDYENTLRPIKLGLNQFPVLALDNCSFVNEK